MFGRRVLRPRLAIVGAFSCALSCALLGCGDVSRPAGDPGDPCPLPSPALSSFEAADAARCAMRARGDDDARLVLLGSRPDAESVTTGRAVAWEALFAIGDALVYVGIRDGNIAADDVPPGFPPCPDGDLRLVDSTVLLPDAWSRLESPDVPREDYQAMLYQALPCALEPARADEAVVTLLRDPDGELGSDFVVYADTGAFLRVCEDCPGESDCDCF